MITNDNCCFYEDRETLNHLFFQCNELKEIWNNILCWLQMGHSLGMWSDEIKWITGKSKGKDCKTSILKCVFVETIYETRNYRNSISFRKDPNKSTIGSKIIDIIVYRCWVKLKFRKFMGRLMMP